MRKEEEGRGRIWDGERKKGLRGGGQRKGRCGGLTGYVIVYLDLIEGLDELSVL